MVLILWSKTRQIRLYIYLSYLFPWQEVLKYKIQKNKTDMHTFWKDYNCLVSAYCIWNWKPRLYVTKQPLCYVHTSQVHEAWGETCTVQEEYFCSFILLLYFHYQKGATALFCQPPLTIQRSLSYITYMHIMKICVLSKNCENKS